MKSGGTEKDLRFIVGFSGIRGKLAILLLDKTYRIVVLYIQEDGRW